MEMQINQNKYIENGLIKLKIKKRETSFLLTTLSKQIKLNFISDTTEAIFRMN